MQIEQIEHVLVLFGNADQNIKIIEEHFGVNIVCRGTEVKITGESEAVSKAQRTIDTLLAMIQKDGNLSEQNIRYVMTLVEQGSEQSMVQMNNSCIAVTVKGKPIKPKTLGQKNILMRSRTTPSPSASVRQVPAKPILLLPWRFAHSAMSRSAASS